ncbi:MAG: hypothetical protein ABWK04_08595 [Hydrogenobacter sp.]
MRYLIVFALFGVLACANMVKKLDSRAGDLYTRGYEGERDFKVLVKDTNCVQQLKKLYKVKAESGKVLVLTLTHTELESIVRDECVIYVSPSQKLELK